MRAGFRYPFLALLLAATIAASSPPTAGAFNLIDEHPPQVDGATWIYQGNYGYGYGELMKGTSEHIDVLPSNLRENQIPEAIEVFRRPLDLHGYPMRISLIDKLFTAENKLQWLIAAAPDETRQYDPRKPAYQETVLHGPGMSPFAASGPLPANSAIIAQYQAPFAFAVHVLQHLNIPEDQKDLSRYVVMFVDTPNVTWMEFGPAFAPGETPHLGCETQVGRDFVVGYLKGSSDGQTSAPVIPCF